MNASQRQPMDAHDLNVLGVLLDIHEVLDPTPAMLPDVILFALGATDLDAEMARLVVSEGSLVGTRGAPVEHARRITFSSDHLTVMVAVEPHGDGSVRLDGWAAPGGGLRVELRSSAGQSFTECDDTGRFAFDEVPPGPAQIILHPTAISDPAVTSPVVTPAVHL